MENYLKRTIIKNNYYKKKTHFLGEFLKTTINIFKSKIGNLKICNIF